MKNSEVDLFSNINEKEYKELKKSMTNFNILDKIPKLYHKALYCLIVLNMTELVIEGARESGKTIFFQNLILLFSVIYPEGDIVITRNNQNEHMRALVPRIKNLLRDSWIVEALPELRNFKWDDGEMWFYRVHSNGHIQKIWFIGEKMGGIQKNKSVSPDGYFSLVIKDEAEENNEVEASTPPEKKRQLTEDKKRTFRRRDSEKYKNYDIYPRTKFVYGYNPKEENGEFEDLMSQYLEPNIPLLDNDGYQMKIIPNYKNGSGIVLIRNNMNHLLNDKFEFRPSKESINEMKWFKENEPEIYKMDYLGIRWENQTAFFAHYRNILRTHLDAQYIPISIGIDQGLSDDAGMVVNVNEYTKVNNEIVLSQINGSLFTKSFNGKRLMTIKQSRSHIIYTAKEIVEFLVSNIFINKEWVEWYKKEMLWISCGPKDEWLMSEIEDQIERDYPQFSGLIWFNKVKDAHNKYDIESRIKLEQSQNKKRTQIMSKKLTPELYQAYMKYNRDNYKSGSWKELNLIDAYFYSKYRFYKEVSEITNYTFYEN